MGEMRWEWSGSRSVHEAVDRKSGGRAEEFTKEDHTDYTVRNIKLLADRIRDMDRKEKVTIVGDYDADGVMAISSMYTIMRTMGFTNATLTLPKRMSEGYGLSPIIIDRIDTGTVITVDNGIAAIDAIKKGKEKGLTIFVTDHHQPVVRDGQIILPPADLIVDPHVPDDILPGEGETMFREYCGAGLIYKLAKELIPGTLADCYVSTFAAIATVADVVSLTGDNRKIFREGMQNILTGYATKGIMKMVSTLRSENVVNEKDIGFKIAPMLNAPGRMVDDGAKMAVSLALANNQGTFEYLYERVYEINEVRKECRDEAVDRAVRIIEREGLIGQNPIVIYDPETPEGILGLAASHIQEAYNCSAIVFTDSGDGKLKGSGRAAEYDNLKASLDAAFQKDPDSMLGYGGHKGAAGLAIKKENLERFRRLMNACMQPWQGMLDALEYDVEIEASQLDETLKEVLRYAPYGEGNPDLVFKVNNFVLSPMGNAYFREIGTGTVKLCCGGSEAIGFGKLQEYIDMGCPLSVDIIGVITCNMFKGAGRPSVEIIDFRPSETAEKKKTEVASSLMSALQTAGLC